MNRTFAWGEQQISRFQFRQALFIRRGMPEDAAEKMGDRLAQRDYERDDRRICLECSHLQRGGTCFVAAQGAMPCVSTKHLPVTNILQRCDHFTWQSP